MYPSAPSSEAVHVMLFISDPGVPCEEWEIEPARGSLHVISYLTVIAKVPTANSHTTIRPVKTRPNPNSIASRDTVMDIDILFFPNVFNLALDRDQRNVKMGSGPLPVSTQDNGSAIHQAGQSSKAKLDNMIKRLSCNKVFSCTPRAAKTS